MPPEMQIIQDIKAAFLAAFNIVLITHYGDQIKVAEAEKSLTPTNRFAYWLIPEENDKDDNLADSTEGWIQTFTATIFIFGYKPEEVIQELYRVFAFIYKTSDLIAGITDAPQKHGNVWFHRFDPRDNRMTLIAQKGEGGWYIQQELLISASIDV